MIGLLPTVIGSEIEYCVLVYDRNGHVINNPNSFFSDPVRQSKFVLEFFPEEARSLQLDYMYQTGGYVAEVEPVFKNTLFLPNGARFYFDTNYHPEYAAAEGLGPRAALIHQMAGDMIMEYAVARANEIWPADGFSLRLFKNNLAYRSSSMEKTESYGAHESYLVLRNDHTSEGSLKIKLVPFFISRLIFSGIGWLARDKGRLAYHLSQRAEAEVTTCVVSGATTSQRAIINTRDESHCGVYDKFYRRIHVIIGDSLTAEPALYFLFAATSMVLDMISSGFYPDSAYPGCNETSDAKVLDALRIFNEDSSLRATANLGGVNYTAINLQEIYRDLAYKYFEVMGKLAEVKEAFDLWNKLIECAKSPRPHEVLRPYVEQAAKKYIMELALERLGYGWDVLPTEIVSGSKRHRGDGDKGCADSTLGYYLKDLDFKFHEMSPRGIDFKFHERSPRGIARILIERGEMKRVVSEAEVRLAISEPCPGARSEARSKQLKWLMALARSKGKDFVFKMDVDWERTVALGSDGTRYSYDNSYPFRTDPGLPIA